VSNTNNAEYMDNSFGTMSNNENGIESPSNEVLLKSIEKKPEDIQERKAVITVSIKKESAGSNKPMSSGAVPQVVVSP
jgi:hypothetical protein